MLSENAVNFAKDIFYRNKHNANPADSQYPLTRDLSFILKYTEKVSANDVLTIANTPGYNIMAPYFGLKILDQEPLLQKQMLQEIVNAFKKENGRGQANDVIKSYLSSYGSMFPNTNFAEVSPIKLSRIAAWGPTEVNKRATDAIRKAKLNRQTPTIVAYGGLVALESTAKEMEEDDEAILIMPKRINTDEKGFMLKQSQDRIIVDNLQPDHFEAVYSTAIIDDTTHSGNTFANVAELFPNAEITNFPLFHS